jgi:hypothetical protein
MLERKQLAAEYIYCRCALGIVEGTSSPVEIQDATFDQVESIAFAFFKLNSSTFKRLAFPIVSAYITKEQERPKSKPKTDRKHAC